ncbi:MAG: helix-turn-helix domain-containing protein [Myxococcota bacterium]|jgi:AcrR family transcriptional regulator|nr:helix-turn-helix domain-containing protein [Myxococcota bacterium]
MATDLVSRQREERRERILEVARELIAEQGPAAVTMRDLAERGLVSVPTLYVLFGSKNELLFAAVESYFTDIVDKVEVGASERGLSRILSLIETLCRETPRHAEYARSMIDFLGTGSETGALAGLVVEQLADEITSALEQMKKKRQLASWADIRPLGERLAGQMNMTTFAWARHQITDEGLRPAMLYGASVTLLGLARGQASKILEALVKEHQALA